jgi:CheY-like chemotaxis protein
VSVASDYGATVAMLAQHEIDCVVLDAEALVNGHDAPAGDSEPALEALPIVLYGEAGDASQLARWQRLAKTVIMRKARTPEDLLDQASFQLHRVPGKMPEAHRNILRGLHDANQALTGKRAMIVDDDMRNIFALSSLLEDKGMAVVSHDNGRDAVRSLQDDKHVDVILMDIMMPEMDGIDTIREIRKIPACKHIPIIAVTAKAMKGDREKCMEAGAWDYLSKPVDTELMVGVLRAWLG